MIQITCKTFAAATAAAAFTNVFIIPFWYLLVGGKMGSGMSNSLYIQSYID